MVPAMDTDAYTLLRSALALFKSPPDALDGDQLQQARLHAAREYELETRVLQTPEALRVIISPQELEDAFRQIRSRYVEEQEFLADLRRNRLDVAQLQRALYRECRVNAVLALAGSRAPAISEVEVGIYYHAHPEKFVRPERREVRHILITINADYAENSSDRAWVKMREIAAKLAKKPYKFEELALQYSECPTAVQGGMLGTVVRGTLYPQLDAILFGLRPGQISGIVETEIGLHILQCTRVERKEFISLQHAAPKIRKVLEERSRRLCQRAWVAGLLKTSHKVRNHESAA